MIGPNTSFKVLWNLVIFILVLQTAIVMPVRIAFFETDDNFAQWWLTIDITSDIFFLFDIFVNFISVEEDHNGVLILERKKLA